VDFCNAFYEGNISVIFLLCSSYISGQLRKLRLASDETLLFLLAKTASALSENQDEIAL
jgi:hypothetical protein